MTWSIKDRTVLITGGNSGLGKATAVGLAREGARVVITSRDMEKGTAAAEEIAAETGVEVEVMPLDLADLAVVRSFSERFHATHDDLAVLVNNAGGIFGSRRETVDGFEMTIGTNHVGPFILTNLLTDLLIASAPSRIVNVASSGHGYAEDGMYIDDLNWTTMRYNQRKVYGHSKLANILHARELSSRLADRGVTAYAVHPGVVATGFGSGGDSAVIGIGMKLISRWLRTPEEGAETAIWAATDPDIVNDTGEYFADKEIARSTHHARDDEVAARLWETTEAMANG